MAESEAIQTVVSQSAINAAMAALIVIREIDGGPCQVQSQHVQYRNTDKDTVDKL